MGGQVRDESVKLHSHTSVLCTCRSDSLFTADEGGHRIDPQGIWRTDNMEAAVRRADTNPVDTKFGPPSIVRRGLLLCACPAAARSLLCVGEPWLVRWFAAD